MDYFTLSFFFYFLFYQKLERDLSHSFAFNRSKISNNFLFQHLFSLFSYESSNKKKLKMNFE